MNEDNQKIAIAEACGWTKCRLAIKGAGAPERGKSPYGVPPRRGYEVSLPNYTQDLNAMHEAETCEAIQRVGYAKYIECLAIACGTERLGALVFATAAQRAEAFLRTIGKWKE